MRRSPRFLLLLPLLLIVGVVAGVRADLPGRAIAVWSLHTTGIWRKEVRAREIARWYRHYEWTTIQRLWLKRRAEGVWVTGQALDTFVSRTHCVIRNPNGPGVWRIWRTFSRVDVRRFRKHYRVFWVGHVNPVLADSVPNPNDPNPLNARFGLAMDHLEIVTPMEPADPNPVTPGINEAVMIMDENGLNHFLGEPGFEMMPDTQMNPNGFQLATTVQSTEQLPPAPQRIVDPPMPPGPGMVEVSPGVVVQWLVDINGNVLVDDDGIPGPDPMLSPTVLGGQKHQGLIGQPTGVDGNVLPLDQGNTQLQLYCWCLAPNGEVLGALPGQVIVGPPVDIDGNGLADNAPGAPIPMDPTVRDDNNMIDNTAVPVMMDIVEEDAPTPAELNAFNQKLIMAGHPPVSPPFQLCINRIRVRKQWGIDRRFVMDTWFHHWFWRFQSHYAIQTGLHRVWITKVALSQFLSQHHHFVVGHPPSWNTLFIQHVRFFRVCYRIYCPRPAEIRLKIDQLWLTVPVDPNNPNSPLMLITTEMNENNLLPPPVLAGLQPDPLPVGPDGVFVEDLDPFGPDGLDVGGGGTGIFDGNLGPLDVPGGTMANIPIVANQDLEELLNNNQLQLYCWALNADGTQAVESFPEGVSFTMGATPTIPSFRDNMGNFMADPTPLELEMASSDASGDPYVPPPVPRLAQNFPNPFQQSTTISFEVPREEGGTKTPVKLSVYDLQGRLITDIVNGGFDAGRYFVSLDRAAMGDAASGIYFYRLTAGKEVVTRKLSFTR